MSVLTRERVRDGGVVRLPQVNLIPPEIIQRRRLRHVQAGLGGAGAAALVLLVVLFLLAVASVSSARSDLDRAQADRAAAQRQVDSYAHVRQTYTLVDQARGLLSQAGAREVLWSRYLNDLSLRVPDGAWLTKVTVAPATPTTAGPVTASGAATTPGAAPAAGQPIAQITFDGTALSHVDVARWLDSIAKERGWANPYFTRSEEKYVGVRKTYNFTSSVTVTAEALSGRYAKPAGS